MVIGRGEHGEQGHRIHKLPPNKSQSTISIHHHPTTHTYQRTLSSSSLLSSRTEPPIIVHVPITAPKATATTLSRATSPTPPSPSHPASQIRLPSTLPTKGPVPPHLKNYAKNAKLKRVKHPLEENVFSSLLITLVAVSVALLVGVPVLLATGAFLLLSLSLRYSVLILHTSYSWVRFICSSGGGGSRARPAPLLPRDRLAFANDVRWLGKRGRGSCQAVLQTLLVFEGGMDINVLRHLVLTRVVHAETPEGEPAYPRLTQRLIPIPAGYRWERDASFDIQNHVVAGPPGLRSEGEMQAYLGGLLSEPLSLSRPMWELRVLSSYGAQRDTLAVLRVHQCLADGMTLVRILSHSLADQAQMHIPQRPHFAGLSFGFNVIRALIVGPFTFFLWVFTTFRDRNLFSVPLGRKKVGKGKAEKGGKKRKRRKGRSKGTWNVVWSAPLSVPKVARVKSIMRSSLNDVLLSAAAGSVRNYLQDQGVPCPDDVRVVIPVDLRNDITSPKSSTKLGCKVASVLASIPSGMEGAIPRLWATRHRLDELKASADPVVAYGATTVFMNILPHRLGVALMDSITDKASLQFSNLPGPTHTLIVGGVPLKGIYPVYPPSGRIRVGISVFSYADQVHLTVVSHKSLPAAGPKLLHGISTEVDQLAKQLSQRRVPGESRRSARNASVMNPEMTKPPTRQIHMQLQVVQEELQELSHRLDTPPLSGQEELDQEELLAGGQAQLRTRMRTLKSEFTELMGELRRRSSIVEGVPMSFEDEECEEDFRKPRKRALSVVSISMSRRNSLFSSGRSMGTPESSGSYPSDDEDLPSSPGHDQRHYQQHHPSAASARSPMRTTAV